MGKRGPAIGARAGQLHESGLNWTPIVRTQVEPDHDLTRFGGIWYRCPKCGLLARRYEHGWILTVDEAKNRTSRVANLPGCTKWRRKEERERAKKRAPA